MNIAVIPARGGSKRIPRKNVRPFCGKPMLAWSIASALESGCFDHVVVSTDDPEIVRVAVAHGAEAPFERPEALSGDHVGVADAVVHAIEWWSAHRRPPARACLIYATAPLLRPHDLRRGLARLDEAKASYALSVTTFPFPIARALRVDEGERLAMVHPEHEKTRSQDLEERYHDAGQFCWGTREAWLEAQPIFGPGSVAVPIPRHLVQDIDTPEDWTRAERLFEVERRTAERTAG